jgi:hypothetical protein
VPRFDYGPHQSEQIDSVNNTSSHQRTLVRAQRLGGFVLRSFVMSQDRTGSAHNPRPLRPATTGSTTRGRAQVQVRLRMCYWCSRCPQRHPAVSTKTVVSRVLPKPRICFGIILPVGHVPVASSLPTQSYAMRAQKPKSR